MRSNEVNQPTAMHSPNLSYELSETIQHFKIQSILLNFLATAHSMAAMEVYWTERIQGNKPRSQVGCSLAPQCL
jgi:hypothetical protein